MTLSGSSLVCARPPFSGEYTFELFLQESGQNLRRNSEILAF